MNDLYEIDLERAKDIHRDCFLSGNGNDFAKMMYLRHKKEGYDMYNYYWQRSRKRTLEDKIWFKRQFE